MRGDKIFFDSNVLIYAFTKGDPRTPAARALLDRGGVVGVQVLNEFVSVARGRMRMPWADVLECLRIVRLVCPTPEPVTLETHERAMGIARLHGYHIYDALIIAAALKASCDTLYTEDLHDGHVIDGLTIRNPFAQL
jgi:predicted nucleic acid-binding protein